MEILKSAVAGTLESSDAMVTVEPGEGISLELSSSVMNQYCPPETASYASSKDIPFSPAVHSSSA